MRPVMPQQLVAAATQALVRAALKKGDAERRISGCSPTHESLAQWPVPMQPPRHLRVRDRPHGASATTDLPTGGMRYARYSERFQSLAAVSQASGCRKAPPHCRFAKKGDEAKVVFLRMGPSPRHVAKLVSYVRGGSTYLRNLTVGKQVLLRH